MVGHRIPDCFLGAAVQDCGQVDESLPGANISNVAQPFHPGSGGGEVPLDQIRAQVQVGGGDRRADFRPRACGFQAQCPHEEAHRVGVDLDASACQSSMDSSVPVGAVGVMENPFA